MRFWDWIKPVDVDKNRQLIYEYWEKDKQRKIIESKIVKHSQDVLMDETIKIKKYLENLGATDLMIITEDVNAPKLTFKIGNQTFITNEIYDFTYEKIKQNLNCLLKDV